jgi:hypothetical protein
VERRVAAVTEAAAPTAAIPFKKSLAGADADGAPVVSAESGGIVAPDPVAEAVAPAEPVVADPAVETEGGTVATGDDAVEAEAATAGEVALPAETGGMADEEPVPAGTPPDD